MKKSALALLFTTTGFLMAGAQTVQEGVNHLYAERYQSAKSTFEKLTAANPNNLEAVYWLGQTHVAMGDVAGAKGLYQRSLAANGNSPWVLVGDGHIDLVEGRAAEARTQFEQAIAVSKDKKGANPAVLAAVGRANVQPYTDDNKIGDLDYAVTRLNEAIQLAPTNPDIAVTLGNAYRKKHVGGDAVQAYRKAGTYAPALHRTASIYKSQRNWDAMMEYLNAAIAADAKYAPAYEDFYAHSINETRNLEDADKWGKLYVANSDPSPDNDYIIASICYLRKDYTCAISTANKIIQATNNSPKSRVYRLLAYSHQDLKDTTQACQASNQFFERAAATGEEILANDYLLHAKICGRGNPDIVQADIMKALAIDTLRSRQIAVLNDAIRSARAERNYGLEGNLMLMSHRLREGTTANPADLFYIGTLFYYADQFPTSDSVMSAYITSFPDTLQGYYWRGLVRSRIDTSMTQGLAVPDFEKTLQLGEADKVRFKSQAAQSAYVLAAYHVNAKRDRAAALEMIKKGLEFDPENAALLRLNEQLTPKQTQPAKPAAKPKTTSAGTKKSTATRAK